MFCSHCGSPQNEELRFCKACGAILHAVRQAVATQTVEPCFDWSRTWIAEMFMSHPERRRRSRELDRLYGITPDLKRHHEIKAGVITSFIGLGVSIFLYFLMQGVILSGQNPPGDSEILSRVWIAGVIPLCVGLGLIVNGAFVSKRLRTKEPDELVGQTASQFIAGERDAQLQVGLKSAERSKYDGPEFSVTDNTTRNLTKSAGN